jgi:dTDP-4-dehydrorhamnose reductase
MDRLVILGKGGQLGQAFCRLLDGLARPYVAYGKDEVNFLHLASLEFPLHGVRAVINCSAYTNVDGAEADETIATRINGEAVGVLALRCRQAKIPLVHFSTDYVFDGKASRPYTNDHPVAPLNAYGRSKARGETLLRESGADHLLIRTSWVYAPWGNNFVLTMARLMRGKPEIKVVSDQQGRPTHVNGLAERTLVLLEGGHRGVFHLTDGGQCTWFEFASEIAAVMGSNCRLIPCTTAEFPRPAARPAYSVLDTSRADELLGAPPHYSDRLRGMREALQEVS